jgi:hypothetical protein
MLPFKWKRLQRLWNNILFGKHRFLKTNGVRSFYFFFFASLENPIQAYGSITNSEKLERGLLNVLIEMQYSLQSRADTNSPVLKVNTGLLLHKDLLPAVEL